MWCSPVEELICYVRRVRDGEGTHAYSSLFAAENNSS